MKRILIFYSHFFPAFKAGGPVQSLIHLVEVLREDFEFFIVCSAKDMGDSEVLEGITPNQWNPFGKNVKIFYVNGSIYPAINAAFKESKPHQVYINGLYLARYNWLPLWFAKRQNIKVVMAPRGMLQKGALAIKPLKKKLFLKVFKWLGLHKNIVWHATDKQEKEDIKRVFGETASVYIAFDIPKPPTAVVAQRPKQCGQLRMVYLSLITEKKNLLLVLKALKEIKIPVQFDIYGPVKDQGYWKKCEELMAGQAHTIHYHGVLNPEKVQHTLSGYHLFILPTNGENFGHAIYEALSAGTPALISPYTPWGSLQDFGAGTTIALNMDCLITAIQEFIQYDQEEFSKLSLNANRLAMDYFYKNDFRSDYNKLFS